MRQDKFHSIDEFSWRGHLWVVKRQQDKVAISSHVKALLDGYCEGADVTQKKVVEDLIKWFVDQDAIVQGVILKVLPANDDMASLIVARMRGKK